MHYVYVWISFKQLSRFMLNISKVFILISQLLNIILLVSKSCLAVTENNEMTVYEGKLGFYVKKPAKKRFWT